MKYVIIVCGRVQIRSVRVGENVEPSVYIACTHYDFMRITFECIFIYRPMSGFFLKNNLKSILTETVKLFPFFRRFFHPVLHRYYEKYKENRQMTFSARCTDDPMKIATRHRPPVLIVPERDFWSVELFANTSPASRFARNQKYV